MWKNISFYKIKSDDHWTNVEACVKARALKGVCHYPQGYKAFKWKHKQLVKYLLFDA